MKNLWLAVVRLLGFVTFSVIFKLDNKNTDDSCTSEAAESQWIIEVKDKEVNRFFVQDSRDVRKWKDIMWYATTSVLSHDT